MLAVIIKKLTLLFLTEYNKSPLCVIFLSEFANLLRLNAAILSKISFSNKSPKKQQLHPHLQQLLLLFQIFIYIYLT